MPIGLKGFQRGHPYFVKNKPFGELNPNWKGGIYFDKKQYQCDYYKKWYEKNKEKRQLGIRQWRETHREDCSKASVRWAKRNPERKAFWVEKRRCWRMGAIGLPYTLQDWQRLKQKYNYTCPICGRKEPEIKLTVDHKIPLSKDGSDSIENIQPLCLSCNCKKYNK